MGSSLKEKVAIVTGASRGLGKEYAKALAAARAHVIAPDIKDCTAVSYKHLRAQETREDRGFSLVL